MLKNKVRSIIAIIICLSVLVCGVINISAYSSNTFLYYDQLSVESKNFYDAIKDISINTSSMTVELASPITVSSYDIIAQQKAQQDIVKSLQSAIDAAFRDYPEIYWVKLGENGTDFGIYYAENTITNKITFNKIKINIVRQDYYRRSLEQENNTLWKNIREFPVVGETRYEKVKSIHDELCRRITYKETNYCYDVVGALNYNEAVCEGISEAFKLICDYNNIPCITIAGTGITSGGSGGSGPHMWNYVKMEDGRWYAVDATWDLGENHTVLDDYLLVGSDTHSPYYDDTFAQSHIPSGDFSGSGMMEFEYPTLSEEKYVQGAYPPEPTTTQPTTTEPVPTTASAPTTTQPTTTEPTPTTASAPTTTTSPATIPTNTIKTLAPVVTTTEPAPTMSATKAQVLSLQKVKNVVAKGKKKSVTITFSAVKGAQKYVVKYSYKKNMKGAKTKIVKKPKLTIKKLKSGKKVYIKVYAQRGKIKGKLSKRAFAKVK